MAVVTIIRGENYTDDHPLELTVTDMDGTAVDFTGASFVGNIKDVDGTVISPSGSTQGSTWDDPTAGKAHLNITAAETSSLVESLGVNHGWLDLKITFSDGGIRYTEKESCDIQSPLA